MSKHWRGRDLEEQKREKNQNVELILGSCPNGGLMFINKFRKYFLDVYFQLDVTLQRSNKAEVESCIIFFPTSTLTVMGYREI